MPSCVEHSAIIGLKAYAKIVRNTQPLLSQICDQGYGDAIEVPARTSAIDDAIGGKQLGTAATSVQRDIDCAILLVELRNSAGKRLQTTGTEKLVKFGRDLRRHAMTMDVPARPQVAQELKSFIERPLVPDRRHDRSCSIEDALPGDALCRRFGDLLPKDPQQLTGGRGKFALQEGGPYPSRFMHGRQKTSPRDGKDGSAMAVALQMQSDIDHGQACADQKHGLRWRDVFQSIGRPRIGDKVAGVVEPTIRTAWWSRRQIPHGQHQKIGFDLTPVCQKHATPGRTKKSNDFAPHGMKPIAAFDAERGLDALLHVIAKQDAWGKTILKLVRGACQNLRLARGIG